MLEQISHEVRQALASPSRSLIALMRRAQRSTLLDRLRRLPPRRAVSRRKLAQRKTAIRREAQLALDKFLASRARIVLPQAASPQVSIILVLFNQAPFTLKCLQTIAAHAELPVEIVIIDNGSTDSTRDLLERVDGARIIRNAENRHFVHGVNQAAALARGEALLLLNNDAFIRGGALQAAWHTLYSRPEIGAVGGPLVLADGTVQEAGSIVWSDGSCVGYGRGRDPGDPEFQFVREVDFCSGAFLLIRRLVLESLGGLDAAFAPAYYEEVDLCMRMREAGWRVLFEPRAIADHFEFASARSTQQALLLQQQHHAQFVKRHSATLGAAHHPPGSSELRARMRGEFRGRLLMIEDRVPFPSLGTGYPRSARMLHELIAAGWFVTLYPLVFPHDDWADIRRHFPPGLEVMVGQGEAGLGRFLEERLDFYDTILVTRPHNMQSFLRASEQKTEGPRLVYDAEAIFADRQMAALAIAGVRLSEAQRLGLLASEIKLARSADMVIAVTERDAAMFRGHGCADVRVLGHALPPAPAQAGFACRADLLFVGALDSDQSPNTDAVLWFISEVMPRLDALIGDEYRLIVAGRCTAERLISRAGPRIRLLGRVEDLTPLYAGTRLFIAPTRFAAGIPLKIQEAAARGLPIVATSLLAGQLGWENDRELLVADTAETFAAACARLYGDAVLWQQLRDAALARISIDCSQETFAQNLRAIMRPRFRQALPESGTSTRLLLLSTLRFRAARVRALAVAGWRRWREHGWKDVAERAIVELRKHFRPDYDTWVRLYDTVRAADLSAMASHIAAFPERPRFALAIIVDRSTRSAAVRATLDSICAQVYPHWEVVVAVSTELRELHDVLNQYAAPDRGIRVMRCEDGASDAVLANVAITETNGEFVATITAGDQLRPHTLYMLALAYNADPDVQLIYGDEDRHAGGQNGRSDPVFKPDWSPELLFQPEVIGRFMIIRRGALIAAGGYRDRPRPIMEFDLLLRIADAQPRPRITHVPRVLYHREDSGAVPVAELLGEVVHEHLRRAGESAGIEIAEGVLRVAYHLPDPPPVSIIIPTRDQPMLLRRCVAGLLAVTDYPRLELVIVDNDSRDPATRHALLELAKDPRVRVLPYRRPFNYAAMNNLALAGA
ncbi:MAG: glycosyltransferase [Alphaproteobacteria bacterium]|nr:glycosyltransferase [Alphaproteobacteria bacterium]